MRRLGIVPVVVTLSALFMVLPSTGAAKVIKMADFRFRPASIALRAGDSVTFSNVSKSTHTASCQGCPVDTGDVQPGLQRTVRFAKPGTFQFLCRYHSDRGMALTVTVKALSGAGDRPTNVTVVPTP